MSKNLYSAAFQSQLKAKQNRLSLSQYLKISQSEKNYLIEVLLIVVFAIGCIIAAQLP